MWDILSTQLLKAKCDFEITVRWWYVQYVLSKMVQVKFYIRFMYWFVYQYWKFFTMEMIYMLTGSMTNIKALQLR